MFDPKRFGKVAVMSGGESSEREASLKSGAAVFSALHACGLDVHHFDPKDHSLLTLVEEKFSCVFIALLGGYGENGSLQGALDLLRIPYTGSGVLASSIGMDKWRTKLAWRGADIPTPRYEILTAESDFAAIEKKLGLPIVVKPAREGSSIGICCINKTGELRAAYKKAAEFDDLVLAEEFIAGVEYTATILDDVALPLVEVEKRADLISYDAKYADDDTTADYHCPSRLPKEKESSLRALSLQAFRVLGCDGCARIDLIVDRRGDPYLLEINTCPWIADDSLVGMAANAANINFENLLLRMLSLALEKGSRGSGHGLGN